MKMYSFPSGPNLITPPSWLPRPASGVGSRAKAGCSARSLMMLISCVSVEPFHTKRSTRLPNRGVSLSTVVSAPVVLSVQYR